MTTTVLMTVKNVFIQLLISCGRVLSMVSMSLENLFRIRPMGVVSKNDMGDLRMLESIFECSSPDARTILTAVTIA